MHSSPFTGRVSQSPLNFLDQAFMTPPPSASLSSTKLTHRSPIEGTIKAEEREVCRPKVVDAMDVDSESVEKAEFSPDVDVDMPLATLTERRQKLTKVLLPNCAGFGKHFTTSKQEGRKKKDTSISMHFSVNQHQFTSIQNWNHRMIAPIHEDRRDTLCLSLACYLKAEMGKNPNYDELKPSWPRGNQLHLEITKQDGKTRSIPLAPPNASVLIPDGFVDIGFYIRLGENTIKLVQDGDLFAYVYCLHTHLPTLAQVQKLNQQIEKQEEWEAWCKNVSGPLDLPPSRFSTTRATGL
ncbi:hypothetical protein BDP27DRAFT_1323994 [Rhodocollybia butyracea]|uniref:Uncharacterized protein n=1 Tax=Rhodocollybia butyracea TaxID=206335 RepID=A0A9P5PW71_9AGAR|nr:hypothetical protein BDP27DRAFT_1323994 [Rhodocollybia butyracea]